MQYLKLQKQACPSKVLQKQSAPRANNEVSDSVHTSDDTTCKCVCARARVIVVRCSRYLCLAEHTHTHSHKTHTHIPQDEHTHTHTRMNTHTHTHKVESWLTAMLELALMSSSLDSNAVLPVHTHPRTLLKCWQSSSVNCQIDLQNPNPDS